MNIKNNAKNKVKKKIKKIVFNMIKPFLPFILIIVGIIFAISTVADSLFTTEDDMAMAEKLNSDDYEKQYSEWLGVKDFDATIIDAEGLIPTDMFIWPVPGYTKITSPFGMRTHPITGLYKLHSGVDVGAPTGANFVAMASGKVITASKISGYGNMVMIDHGNGIVTAYAHGSKILVEKGQEVVKGQPVLKVGSTGNSTGPHAHFEVRINGNFTDPLNYFK